MLIYPSRSYLERLTKHRRDTLNRGQFFLLLGILFLLMIGYVFYRANRFVAEPGKNSDRIFLSFKHKLKTYIASAQLASQTLQNHDALDEIQREKMFRRILTNLKRLNNLIDNISAINKLGKEIKQQNFEKINLSIN